MSHWLRTLSVDLGSASLSPPTHGSASRESLYPSEYMMVSINEGVYVTTAMLGHKSYEHKGVKRASRCCVRSPGLGSGVEGAVGAPDTWLSHRRQVSKRLKKKSKQDEKLSCIDYFESIETKACIQILKVSFNFLNTHAHAYV